MLRTETKQAFLWVLLSTNTLVEKCINWNKYSPRILSKVAALICLISPRVVQSWDITPNNRTKTHHERHEGDDSQIEYILFASNNFCSHWIPRIFRNLLELTMTPLQDLIICHTSWTTTISIQLWERMKFSVCLYEVQMGKIWIHRENSLRRNFPFRMGWRVGIGGGKHLNDDTIALISLSAFDGRCVHNDLRSTD